MSYIGISIKEAMEKINRGWYLPAVQRPYVWGSRYESEKYICKLFDSLYQSYPIGGLIMWETDSRVAHREFLQDYHQGDVYKNVDEGLWERSKSLIYDGQQRLQTLYSCLNYTFNNRVLVFNLDYDEANDTDMDTGFRFIDANEQPLPLEIKMNRLFSLPSVASKRIEVRGEYISKTINPSAKLHIEENLDKLWDVFVRNEVKSLAYFSIASNEETKVNEIFERLNTGGMPLTKADLLYSRIKAVYPEFESEIMEFCKALASRTHLGLDSYDILQVLHMIVRRRTRIDENVKDEHVLQFKQAWDELKTPLNAFFDDYLRTHFHISHIAIIGRKPPLLVLIVFFYEYYRAGMKFRAMDAETLKQIDRFFITAETNDWALQSYSDNFTRIILDNQEKSKFPFDDMVAFVRGKGNRNIEVTELMFTSNRWFALKIMMPGREFEFDNTMLNRFNPELDHIFPVNLAGMDDEYRATVDIVWNMQPVKGEVNNLKSNFHPYDFFADKATKADGTVITGSKYFTSYDFVPPLESPSWSDYKAFIDDRRRQMILFLKEHYGVVIVEENKEIN